MTVEDLREHWRASRKYGRCRALVVGLWQWAVVRRSMRMRARKVAEFRRTFDPAGTNAELSRVLLAVVLGDFTRGCSQK